MQYVDGVPHPCDDINFDLNNHNDIVEKINTFYDADGSPYRYRDDYIEKNVNDLCSSTTFNLQPHQQFLGQLFNPKTNIKSMLIWHGLGSGKTCTSIVMASAFIKRKKPTVIFAVPKGVLPNFKQELIGKISGTVVKSCRDQCIIQGKRQYTIPQKYIKKINQIETQISNLTDRLRVEENRLQLMNIQNEILKLENELNQYQNIIKNNDIFDNNIVSTKNANVKKRKSTFHLYTHDKFLNQLVKEGTLEAGPLSREILAEPGTVLVIDEIHVLVSLEGSKYERLLTGLRYYINKGVRVILLSGTPIFNHPHELALTMNLLRPNIPFTASKDYFGEQFITHDNKIKNKLLFQQMCSGYVSYFKGGNPAAYPIKNIKYINHVIKNTGTQQQIYAEALKSELDRIFKQSTSDIVLRKWINFGEDDEENSDFKGAFQISRKMCNIVFPGTLESNQNNNFDQNNNLLLGALRKDGNLINYSPKFAYILDKIEDSMAQTKGPIFIFSQYLDHGVSALTKLLEHRFNMAPYSADNDSLSYFVWTGETTADFTKILQTVNSPDNIYGEKIKVILGSAAIMQGVDFKNISEVHILEPWWNESRIDQVIARAVRWCSHVDNPDNEVQIYRHYTRLDGKLAGEYRGAEMFLTDSIEQYIRNISEKKLAINSQFETALKEIAVDCNLFKKGNIVRLEAHTNILSNSGEEKVEEEWFIDPSNKSIKYIQTGTNSFTDINNGDNIIETNENLIKLEDIECINDIDQTEINEELWLDAAKIKLNADFLENFTIQDIDIDILKRKVQKLEEKYVINSRLNPDNKRIKRFLSTLIKIKKKIFS